jgi:hypothetical protein
VNMPGSNWGATAAERESRQPCDELAPDPRAICHRAVSIEAPPSLAFRWLCQLRKAPYSYDLLDNGGRRSPVRLTPGADELAIGQRFMRIFELVSFDYGSQLTLRSGGTVVTYGLRQEEAGTRLLVRVRFAPDSRLLGALAPLLVAGDLVMMRKQLITLKRLAERDAGELSSQPGGGSRDGGPDPRRPSA